jgi:hypothetical protein
VSSSMWSHADSFAKGGPGVHLESVPRPYTCVECGAINVGPHSAKTCPPESGRDCRRQRGRRRSEKANAKLKAAKRKTRRLQAV